MSVEQQRWTLHQVVTAKGLRWTYALRGHTDSPTDYATSKLAARAAERAWNRWS